MTFHRHILDIDAAEEITRIVTAMRGAARQFRKQGVVLGISGGVDSSVVLGLCVRAFGPERVTALMLPEKDSDPESERLAQLVANSFGVSPAREEITSVLDGFGCYPRRDEAIRRLFPNYDASRGWKMKITLPNDLLEGDTLNVFSATVISPDGIMETQPLPPRAFLQVVAASNFKQRARMAMLYYHAELRNYAVIGTANKNEHEQGFFVKHGDAGVDFNAIIHLYKTQVYQLAAELGVPDEIRNRPPTSDTYSAPSTQEEFFFRLPFETMDLLWFAQENGFAAEEVAPVMGLTPVQVMRAFSDFERKRRATEYLRAHPLSADDFRAASTPRVPPANVVTL